MPADDELLKMVLEYERAFGRELLRVRQLCPGAVVSLQYVLGEFGVANNYTSWITCVFPDDLPCPDVVDAGTRFVFTPIPRSVLEAGAPDDRLIFAREYLCATPERALADVLYLASVGRWPRVPLEYDIADLDMERLRRLCRAMDIEGVLDAWLAEKEMHDADPDVVAGMSCRLGF
jgi:hypothetical protein